MTRKHALIRLLLAASSGLGSVAACAAAAPVTMGDPQRVPQTPPGWTDTNPAEMAHRGSDKGPSQPPPSPPPSASPDAGAPRCPYGALEDPHRGFVRCLLPEERDARWLPPPPQREPPQGEPPQGEPPPRAEPPDAGAPAPPPTVEIGAPRFENGEVTKVEKSIGKASAELARCVAEHGGLAGETGSVKVQFLVRSRGRAEGVEVISAKGVGAGASACVRRLLKNKAIGAPTADPVGVTVVITFKAAR